MAKPEGWVMLDATPPTMMTIEAYKDAHPVTSARFTVNQLSGVTRHLWKKRGDFALVGVYEGRWKTPHRIYPTELLQAAIDVLRKRYPNR